MQTRGSARVSAQTDALEMALVVLYITSSRGNYKRSLPMLHSVIFSHRFASRDGGLMRPVEICCILILCCYTNVFKMLPCFSQGFNLLQMYNLVGCKDQMAQISHFMKIKQLGRRVIMGIDLDQHCPF
jgi:hypothetical protein